MITVVSKMCSFAASKWENPTVLLLATKLYWPQEINFALNLSLSEVRRWVKSAPPCMTWLHAQANHGGSCGRTCLMSPEPAPVQRCVLRKNDGRSAAVESHPAHPYLRVVSVFDRTQVPTYFPHGSHFYPSLFRCFRCIQMYPYDERSDDHFIFR